MNNFLNNFIDGCSSDSKYVQDIEKNLKTNRKIVLTSLFADKQDLLFLGDKSGVANLVDWRSHLSKSSSPRGFNFRVHSGPIYSSALAGDNLFCGTDDSIKAFSWRELTSRVSENPSAVAEDVRPAVELVCPQQDLGKGALPPRAEVNALQFHQSRGWLCAGAGDGRVHLYDMHKAAWAGALTGHTDMVHAVALCGEDTVASASEDGLVRLWDLRSLSCVRTLDPVNGCVAQADKAYSRSYQTCLAVDPSGSWLVCGGANRFLTLWHLPTLSVASTMPMAGIPHAVQWSRDQIVCAGTDGTVYLWNKSGKLSTRIHSKTTGCYYSLASSTLGNEGLRVIVGTGSTTASAVDILFEPFVQMSQIQL